MAERITGGYILLARKIIDSEIWCKPPLYIKVWIYLLTQAQHFEYKRLKKGQLFTSIPDIQQACCWYIGCRKVTPTKDQIFQILEWMRKACERNCAHDTTATMIATTKATHGMLITIHNYCMYQNPKLYESNGASNDENPTKATRKQRQPDNINKNDKNDKNNKNDILNTYTSNPALIEAINAFAEMRKTIKKPLTKRALKMMFDKLDGMSSTDDKKIAILNQSTMNCWQGVFELKEQSRQRPAQTESVAERARRLAESYEQRHGIATDSTNQGHIPRIENR